MITFTRFKTLTMIKTLTKLLLPALLVSACESTDKMNPPIAEKKPKELTIHGDTRIDDYYWLRERENENVIAYLEAENEYREAKMKHTADFQKELFDEIV